MSSNIYYMSRDCCVLVHINPTRPNIHKSNPWSTQVIIYFVVLW